MPMLALHALRPVALLAIGAWLASLIKNDVSIADSLWPLFILLAAATYLIAAPQTGPRAVVVVSLVAASALCLAAHITWRSWGEPKDRCYQAMRARNAPNFRWKSLLLVFGLQAALAWVVYLSALVAVLNARPWHWTDILGVVVVVFGIAFEAAADSQLARFKAGPAHQE